nr:hypothetical protein [Tanacetum cinerariifolium]
MQRRSTPPWQPLPPSPFPQQPRYHHHLYATIIINTPIPSPPSRHHTSRHLSPHHRDHPTDVTTYAAQPPPKPPTANAATIATTAATTAAVPSLLHPSFFQVWMITSLVKDL